MKDSERIMVDKIIADRFYQGREIVVKRMGYDTSHDEKISGIPTKWYTGYVELIPSDLKIMGDPKTSDDLNDTGLFSDFYGEVTFFDYLLDDVPGKFAGFDTMHPGTQDVTFMDCIDALKSTAQFLNMWKAVNNDY